MKLNVRARSTFYFDTHTGEKKESKSVWIVDEEQKDYEGEPLRVAIVCDYTGDDSALNTAKEIAAVYNQGKIL